MKYYVWLQYYCAAPVSKSVKSDELKYADGHQHGVQPTQNQVDSLQPSLTVAVNAAYGNYNANHPNAPQPVPALQTIINGREVKTRSEK